MNFGKKLQYDFPKMRGGSKVVWNFSENSSVLVLRGIPYADNDDIYLKQNFVLVSNISKNNTNLSQMVKLVKYCKFYKNQNDTSKVISLSCRISSRTQVPDDDNDDVVHIMTYYVCLSYEREV